MKNKLLKIALFVGIPAILFAASARIKDLATTTTTAAGDDYVALDGTTNGTRKILASYLYGSGNVTNNATLASGNVVLGGGTTVVGVSNITASGNAITFPAGGNITLPTSATPSTTTAGTIAFDTDAWAASRGSIQVYDGTANIVLLGALASDTPSDGQYPRWNTGGTITWETLAAGGNVTNNATLTAGNVTIGGGTTVVGTSNVSWNATNNTLTAPNLTVTTNGTFGNVTTTGLDLSGATITGNLAIGSGLITIGSATGPVAGGLKLFGGTSGNVTIAPTAAAGSGVTMTVPAATDTFVGKATTDTFTNKTFDANATGNVFKAYGYLVITHPTVFGSGVTQQTTVTSPLYGQALFSNSADKATNYVEYILTVPDDIDTSVDLTGKFKFVLGGADTGDHEYEISMINVADSAVYDGALGNAVSLTYTADGSGADKDVETAGAPDTLTGWAAALTAGRYWRIRVARDGDNANDGSTVNSYSGPLVIRYGITQ